MGVKRCTNQCRMFNFETSSWEDAGTIPGNVTEYRSSASSPEWGLIITGEQMSIV